jgi:hypothetical protein
MLLTLEHELGNARRARHYLPRWGRSLLCKLVNAKTAHEHSKLRWRAFGMRDRGTRHKWRQTLQQRSDEQRTPCTCSGGVAAPALGLEQIRLHEHVLHTDCSTSRHICTLPSISYGFTMVTQW